MQIIPVNNPRKIRSHSKAVKHFSWIARRTCCRAMEGSWLSHSVGMGFYVNPFYGRLYHGVAGRPCGRDLPAPSRDPTVYSEHHRECAHRSKRRLGGGRGGGSPLMSPCARMGPHVPQVAEHDGILGAFCHAQSLPQGLFNCQGHPPLILPRVGWGESAAFPPLFLFFSPQPL